VHTDDDDRYFDLRLSWKDIAWIKSVSGLPVAVKGIQTADDAALCAEYGADVAYLSNHGGRQLEGYVSPSIYVSPH
jgi:L-lactate dehydrogenase (cytochrome)